MPPLPQSGIPRTEKKPRSGLLAFLNCCSPTDPLDDGKSDDPDVAAKKIKIQPTPQRTSRPPDQTEVVENEKALEGNTPADERAVQARAGDEDKGELSEKKAMVEDDSRPRISRESAHHEKPAPYSSGTIPAPAAIGPAFGDQGTASASGEDQIRTTAIPAPEPTPKPDVNIIAATPI